jgi:peroxiredoxin Q/BCP
MDQLACERGTHYHRIISGNALKEAMVMPLKTGQAAPAVADIDLKKPTVLYFYPKDDTPGCTVEACEFRDSLSQFAKAGVQVIGVSTDSAESHQKFGQKYGLNFRLVPDPDKAISRNYDVLGQMGFANRVTYLIKGGQIKKAFPKVNPKGHAQEVLSALKELG